MSSVTSTDSAWDRRRWLILGVIGLAQLMVILDLTVMNVALPSAQRALGGALLRRGPLRPTGTPPAGHAEATTAQAEASQERAR
jgi:hypothetical protein